MSIFPRHVSAGDNVIIHVKMMNLSSVCLPVSLDTYIQNKDRGSKKWIVREGFFLLPPAEDGKEGVVERYFSVATDGKMPLGRYDCFTSIKYLDRKSMSLTKKDDHFFLEEITISVEGSSIILKNSSPVAAGVKIYRIGGSATKKIRGLGKIKFPRVGFLYAVYANNSILT
ncbi:MAG: hypothetical protein WC926_00380 [Candidatus Paceibacterota bacterium]|jgi:hypothetical protein